MSLLNKIVNLFCLLLCALWSAFICFIAIPFFLYVPSVGQAMHHAFGRGWLWLMAIRVKWIGLENVPREGGFILAPNHESMFDVLVVASLPTSFSWISKKEVGRIPILGWSMRAMGCFFVSRDRSGKDLNTMQEVEDGLRAGRRVVIFPEGTRTRTGELLPFKKGAFRTAQNAGVPLIPIAITGTRQIAPPGKIPTKRGHNVTVRIGPPFWVPKEKSLPDAIGEFRAELIKLLSEDRR